MAFSLNQKGSVRGRYRPLAEINVTPMVDVMLVLLIIFMVTAPLMTSGVSVDLPKTNAQPINNDSQPLTVSVRANGDVYLQDQQVPLPEVVDKLKTRSPGAITRTGGYSCAGIRICRSTAASWN